MSHYLFFYQIIERIKKYFDILGGPATFIQVCVCRLVYGLTKWKHPIVVHSMSTCISNDSIFEFLGGEANLLSKTEQHQLKYAIIEGIHHILFVAFHLVSQAAVPRIIEQTDEVFFQKTIKILKQTSDICWDMIKEIPCISCPEKPHGSMAVMVMD